MAMLVDRAALHNYILTGDKRRLDGGITVDGLEFVETPSEETPPNQVERWRQQVDAAELPVIPSPTPATPPRTPPRKRSTGPYSPSPSTTLPANSRLELSVPRDIGAWVLSIPQGACPPDDAPWSSPVGGSEDGTEEAIEELLIAHAERKPGPDISTVALSSDGQALQPQGPKPMPNDVEVYKWRSENYVDWWRTGMAAEQQTRPVSVHMPAEGASSKPSLSDLGEVVTKRQMVAKRTLDGEPKLPLERGYSPVDSIPQPPTLIVKPPAQVAQVHATLSLPPPSLVQMSNPENLKRVYYRMINRNEEPLPVRNANRITDSPTADKSMGVLFLDNPSSYRACDLATIIHSRECSHINTPTSPRFSPALHRKFAEAHMELKSKSSIKLGRSSKRSLRSRGSATGSSSLALKQQMQQEPFPRLQIRLKIYFDPYSAITPRTATRLRRRDTMMTVSKVRRLKDNDVLPAGVGTDEASALIVKVFTEELPVISPTISLEQERHRDANNKRNHAIVRSVQKCGKFVAVVVRGTAAGVKSVGDGLVKFADVLSGPQTKRSKSDHGHYDDPTDGVAGEC